jgi:hypothetical protein
MEAAGLRALVGAEVSRLKHPGSMIGRQSHAGFSRSFREQLCRSSIDTGHYPILRLFRRSSLRGQLPRLALPRARRREWFATPPLMVLVVVEATDIVFAVDSIPAILAVTSDPFIVFTSNIFATLLRHGMLPRHRDPEYALPQEDRACCSSLSV